MIKTNKKPKIRFLEYTDQYKLVAFSELYKKTTEKNKLEYGPNKIISVANMYYKDKAGKSDDEYMKTYNVFKKGDIAFEGNKSNKFSYGRFVENTIGNGIVSHVFDVFRPIGSYDIFYWKYAIHNERVMGRVLMRSTTKATMMNNLVAKDFLKQKIAVPSIEEQKQIGRFFETLDKLIALHEQKLSKLQELKKGYLQKLFPKQGEKVPELRFKGFDDTWEQRKLGEIVEFYSGLTYSPDNVQEEGTFVLRSSNVRNGEIVDADNVYVSHDVVNSSNVQKGDIIVVVRNGSRNLIGKHGQIKCQMDNTVIGAFMTGIRSETPDFTNAMLDAQQFAIEINKDLGATINQITMGSFKKMAFVVPANIEERNAVGTFFRNIDDLITFYQSELDLLKEQKKGYLQKMFC